MSSCGPIAWKSSGIGVLLICLFLHGSGWISVPITSLHYVVYSCSLGLCSFRPSGQAIDLGNGSDQRGVMDHRYTRSSRGHGVRSIWSCGMALTFVMRLICSWNMGHGVGSVTTGTRRSYMWTTVIMMVSGASVGNYSRLSAMDRCGRFGRTWQSRGCKGFSCCSSACGSPGYPGVLHLGYVHP